MSKKEEINTINFVSVSPKKAVIEIYGTIGGYDEETWKHKNTIEQMSKELKKLKETKTEEIEVRICSPGGYVDHALAIHDALVDHEAKVITIVNSYCASAATVIAQAGDIRKISKNALYLIHHCSSYTWGNDKEIERELEAQRKTNNIMLNIYKKRCKDEKKLAELFDANEGKGKWIEAEEVLEMGLVDEIYNEAPVKAAYVNPSMMAKLPPIPEGHKIEAEETEKGQKWMEKILNEIKNAVTGQRDNNDKPQQKQTTMKKFATLFPILAVALAMEAFEFKEGEEVKLSEEKLASLEKILKDYQAKENNTKKLEEEKKTAESNLQAMTKERDEYKKKYEACEPPASKSPEGKDDVKKGTFQSYMEESEAYKEILNDNFNFEE